MKPNSLEAFHRRLENSRFSTFLIAKYLHKRGFSVTVSAFDYRPHGSDWEDHTDDGDLYVWQGTGPKLRIDVKHISTDFTGQEDFPHDRMFISDIRAIRRANPHPEAYVILNRAATHMGIVWWRTQRHWLEVSVHASNTDKGITVMACPPEYVDFRKVDVD